MRDDTARRPSKIVILTGAGVSAASGLGTFRDKGGLWTKVDLREVATPEGFAKDPQKVFDFYNMRRKNARAAEPNEAHFALARLQSEYPGEVVIVTQNVDRLDAQAGAEVLHMHGRHDLATCTACGETWEAPLVMELSDLCPECGEQTTRPYITWFGEMPKHLDEIADHLVSADLFVSIGTSGQVYPAAGFVAEARRHGAATLEINLEESDVSHAFDDRIGGPAVESVPAWVEGLLTRAALD